VGGPDQGPWPVARAFRTVGVTSGRPLRTVLPTECETEEVLFHDNPTFDDRER
jgi:hypothetical protein